MMDLIQKYQSYHNECHDISYSIPDTKGQGYFRSVCPRKGIWMFQEEYQLSEEFSVRTSNTSLPMGISYCLSGRVDWAIEGRDEKYTTGKGQSEFLFAGETGGVSTYGADEPIVIINVMICPEVMGLYLDLPEDSASDYLLFEPTDETVDDIVYKKCDIPGYVRQILHQLMRLPCKDVSERLLFQSKVMELVALQMEQFDSRDTALRKGYETSAAGTMISKAKNIIRTRMKSPPSIKNLAHMIGTNETKLKKVFREKCNTTVYGYLTGCRMQKACELLKDHSQTMSEIGAELGYSERTHFCRAFTRYYGMPPSQYRLKLR